MNSNLARKYGYLLNCNPYYQNLIFSIFLISLITKDRIERYRLFAIFLVVITINHLLKISFKRTRPCHNKFSWCPESYDFPSGHSTSAMFWLPFFIYKKDNLSKIISTYLILQPISRVFGGVHSIPAVITGSLLGLTLHYVYKRLFTN
jgi:membrane-associated phospholipid phosphatase